MFVKSNGEINLTCIITRSPEPPVFVFWYHNDRMINYDYNLIGRLETSLHKDLTKSDTVISRLVISNAKGDDNGNLNTFIMYIINLHSIILNFNFTFL